MVLYRKYRPQNLEELIGQELVKGSLLNAFSAGKLAHAYLFVGPRGTGKTSTARILAKMVNCEKSTVVIPANAGIQKNIQAHRSPIKSGMTDEVVNVIPCNKCSTCLSITDGSNLDLIEIDAASNRGIDDIRELRETIKLAPASSNKKVYIIDEVHMLTTEAFNALLKTLEEPPEHVLFILATTEITKIPQTILSRVQRLDFKLAKLSDLVNALEIVVKGEKLKIEKEVLNLIAKASDGSFRDAVKILDQLASLGEITKDQVLQVIKSSDFSVHLELLQALAKKDGTSTLLLLNKQIETGVNIKEFIISLMELLRACIYIKNGLGPSLVKEDFGSEKYQNLMELTFSDKDLVATLNNLQEALEKMKTASIPSLPLEIAIMEVCEDNSKPVEIKTEQKISEPIIPVRSNSPEIAKLQEKWIFVLETIRPFNFSLEALLRSVKIVDCSNGVVLLEVPYSFHQRILEAPKSRDLLESVLSDVLQQTIKVSTVLGERPNRIEDVANIEVAADDEVIRMASEIFNGKLVD